MICFTLIEYICTTRRSLWMSSVMLICWLVAGCVVGEETGIVVHAEMDLLPSRSLRLGENASKAEEILQIPLRWVVVVQYGSDTNRVEYLTAWYGQSVVIDGNFLPGNVRLIFDVDGKLVETKTWFRASGNWTNKTVTALPMGFESANDGVRSYDVSSLSNWPVFKMRGRVGNSPGVVIRQ